MQAVQHSITGKHWNPIRAAVSMATVAAGVMARVFSLPIGHLSVRCCGTINHQSSVRCEVVWPFHGALVHLPCVHLVLIL